MIGETLGHYRFLAKLGEGGMGEVYAAEDTKLQRRVALKVLPPEMAADAERLQRFQREARAIAALNHPHVVTIYSVEEADGVQFLTMELVEGKTLGELIPEGGLPLEELLRLAVPLVEAVAAAHEHGIVHRDLKPANVMLATDGRVKVLDFGLAKLKPEVAAGGETTFLPSGSLTGQHTVVGTAAYMSPEQAEGRPVDHRSDIFSLGVVLYEMACGQRPFKGDTAFSLISSIIKDTPRPLSEVKRDVPVALERIVTKALAKDPAERYQRASELRDELREVQEQTAAGRVVSNLVRVVVRSRWTGRLALAAGLVAIVAGSAWYLLPRPSSVGQHARPGPPRFRTDRLTANPGVEQFPSLLPDGKWIVYSGQASGNRNIYLLSTSGQNPINLTADSTADNDEPAASPDGERIAFRSSREGGGIFVMGRTGEGVRRVTPTGVSAAFNPTWSPDGTEIAYTTENVQLTPLNGEIRSELWIVNVTTGAQRKLEVPDAMQASWSPHGHRIAYWDRQWQAALGDKAGVGVTDLWTIPARGGESVAVTRDAAADWNPMWSRDGRYLYFVSDRRGGMNLWRIQIDEVSGRTLGAPEPITTPAPFLAHPSISADGRRIAFSSILHQQNIQRIRIDPATATVLGEPIWVTTGSQAWANPDPTPNGEWLVAYTRDQPEGHLYVMRSDGTRRRSLTSDAFRDRVPRWSPDKTWVAFFASRSGPLAVWKIRADGSGLQQVSETGSVPVWSPDGTRLATSPAAGSGPTTCVLDPNRPWKDQTPQVLPSPDEALRPFIAQDWSPDGSRLVGQVGFTAPPSRGNGIVVYRFSSRSYERVTDFGEWPSWLPDSRRVLFVAGGKELWVVDTRTKQTRTILSERRDVLGPPRLSRDGRVAFFSRRVTEGDIYLLTFEN